MDDRTKRLVAIGASIGANCHPCVEFHIGKALEQGIGKEEILEATNMAKTVRKGAAASMDALVLKLTGQDAPGGCGAIKPSCGCTS